MCGLVGIVGKSDISFDIFDALTVLQHRGQDGAGILTCNDGKFIQKKGEGLARAVFRSSDMSSLAANMGIGHVR